MQFNGLFMTPNRRYSFSINTPSALAQTTVTIKSALGECSVTKHIETWQDLENAMVRLARIQGGGNDDSVRELARMIGDVK